MRTDEEFADDKVVGSKEWGSEEVDRRLLLGDEMRNGKLVVHSLSGKERNHFYLNHDAGREFENLSAVSGLDSIADSRGFALLDYDRDGWRDVVVVNANQPLTQLFHNDIAQLVPSGSGGMIAIRFVGGNKTSAASELSNRDGYGAMVEVRLAGGVQLKREHRCGEGYAAQNSATMIVGIGDRKEVESVSVRWPSGKKFSIEGVAEGQLVTAYENRAEGAFEQKHYRNSRGRLATAPVVKQRLPIAKKNPGKVQVYTTTATWCAACLSHLPALAQLQGEGIALYGVPIDPDDDAAKLADYVEKKSPPYQMLAEISAEEKESVNAFLAKELKMQNPVLPSSVITDEEGNVLEVMQGIPTLSQVRKWMAAEG